MHDFTTFDLGYGYTHVAKEYAKLCERLWHRSGRKRELLKSGADLAAKLKKLIDKAK